MLTLRKELKFVKLKIGVFRICIVLILILGLSSDYAYAWGPLTHPLINKQALSETQSLPSILDGINATKIYKNSGNGPDIIAFHTCTTFPKDASYEYAHNVFPGPYTGEPLFGSYMVYIVKDSLGRYKDRFSDEDMVFGYGWVSHQLADQVAHGPEGYAETKPTFGYGGPLNHGAAEFGVDCIMFERNLIDAMKVSVTYRPALIHEAAIKFYNKGYFEYPKYPYPDQKIFTCPKIKPYGKAWARGILVTKAAIAYLAATNPALFSAICNFYSDFDDDSPESGNAYNASVYKVRKFLENPDSYNPQARSLFTSSYAWTSQKLNKAIYWVRSFLEKSTARAEEVNSEPKETFYYGFIAKLAEEAEELGAIGIEEIVEENPDTTGNSYKYNISLTDQALFSQALNNVINKDLEETNPQEIKCWAKFMQGLYLLPSLTFQEITTRAEDFTPPTITELNPADGSFINDSTPFISAKVADNPLGIGLDLDALSLKMEGCNLPFSYIPELNLITYQFEEPLLDASCTLDIFAQDKAENKDEKAFSFTIDTIPPEISHTLLNKIINIKKGTKAEIAVSSNEPVTYLMEVFRVKEQEEGEIGEKVYEKEFPQVDFLFWDGMDNSSNLVANGVYTVRITARDRAQNTFCFEERVNVNNEAGEVITP